MREQRLTKCDEIWREIIVSHTDATAKKRALILLMERIPYSPEIVPLFWRIKGAMTHYTVNCYGQSHFEGQGQLSKGKILEYVDS